MTGLPLIAGMWGTTHLSLFLLEQGEDGVVLCDRRSGPGVSKMQGRDFEPVLFDTIRPWLGQPVQAGILLSGMVGSTLGWTDVGYVACPATLDDLKVSGTVDVRGMTVRIASGLSCTNPLGMPDVLRGEETELVGLLALQPALAAGRHLVCIPGTHAKWVAVDNGTIATFCTSVAGELHDVVARNGVLVPTDAMRKHSDVPATFLDGVTTARDQAGHFLNTLFATRSRQIAGLLAPSDARDWLSGLIIGEDVRSALDLFELPETPVMVIGSDVLAARYAAALESMDRPVEVVPSEAAAVHGLWALAGQSGMLEEDRG